MKSITILVLTLFVGHYEVLGRHEVVLQYVRREPLAKASFGLEIVIHGAMVVVSVREDAVDPPGDGAEALGRGLLDGDATREVLVAVEQRSGDVERVEGVVQGGALLGVTVRRAQEDPLLRGGHLGADLGVAFELETDGEGIEFVAELPEVFVLPRGFVLTGRHFQDGVHVREVFSDHLLDVLLTGHDGIHIVKFLVGPRIHILGLGSRSISSNHCGSFCSHL